MQNSPEFQSRIPGNCQPYRNHWKRSLKMAVHVRCLLTVKVDECIHFCGLLIIKLIETNKTWKIFDKLHGRGKFEETEARCSVKQNFFSTK